MQPILQNKYLRNGGIAILIFIVILFFLSIILGSLNSARNSTGLSSYNSADSVSVGAPAFEGGGYAEERMMVDSDLQIYQPPVPDGGNYTADLESYETTTYNFFGKTKQFDEFCTTLNTLKADEEIHFKSLNEETNRCSARLYVENHRAEQVIAALSSYQGVEYSRNVESVTRHKQQIESRTNILRQRLASVQRSLSAAETQYDEIAEFAKLNNDPAALSTAINQKLNQVRTLTNEKINLTNQIDNLYQQAADLKERLGVTEITVSVSRLNPIFVNKNAGEWEAAWEDVKDVFTDTLIGLSTTFIILLLWLLRVTIYLAVVIIVLRGLYKFGKAVSEKW